MESSVLSSAITCSAMVPVRTLSARLSWFAAMNSGMYMDGLGFIQRMYGCSCSCKFQSNTWALSIALPRSSEEISQPGGTNTLKNVLDSQNRTFYRANSTEPDPSESMLLPHNAPPKKGLPVEILPIFSNRLDSIRRPSKSTSLSLLFGEPGVRYLDPSLKYTLHGPHANTSPFVFQRENRLSFSFCNSSYRQRQYRSGAPWEGGHERARSPRPPALIPNKRLTPAGGSQNSWLSARIRKKRETTVMFRIIFLG